VEQANLRGIDAMVDGIDRMTPGTFDLVVFRGSIQHIDEPFHMLRQGAAVLKPGGWMVFLATPNADSLVYKLWGDLPALDPPRNFWIPSARTLGNALQNFGLNVQSTEYPYWGGPYAHPARDLWRFCARLVGIKKPFAFPRNMMEVYARKS